MRPTFLRLREQFIALWTPLSRTQKSSLIAVAIAAVAALGFFGFTATQTPYSPAYTKLSEQDAGAVVDKLKELKIPYQLADGGATILVPSAKLYDTRIQMAQAGLPKSGGIGFELFDQTNIMNLTDFNQRMTFQRALEGELARTIDQMTAVESSRVHLVLPEKQLFSEKETLPTASVVLALKPSAKLDSTAVRAITNLVAGSVEGLKPAGISIADVNGNILWDEHDAGDNSSSFTAQTNLEARTKLEHEVEQKIQSMLDRVLGPNRSSVKVSAELNWDQVQTARETYAPGAPRSQRETSESYNGTGTPSSVPGVTTNVPGQQGGNAANGTQNNYQKKDIVTNYELARTVISTTQAPGTIRRMSVAVFVDGLPDQASVQAISQAVSNAAGLSAERGDTITVSNINFDRTQQETLRRIQEASTQEALYLNLARGSAVAIALIIAAIVVRSLFKSKTQALALSDEEGRITLDEIQPAPLPAGITDPALAAALESLRPAEDRNSPIAIRGRALEEQILGLTKTKPQLIAEIMERWIDQKD